MDAAKPEKYRHNPARRARQCIASWIAMAHRSTIFGGRAAAGGARRCTSKMRLPQKQQKGGRGLRMGCSSSRNQAESSAVSAGGFKVVFPGSVRESEVGCVAGMVVKSEVKNRTRTTPQLADSRNDDCVMLCQKKCENMGYCARKRFSY